MKSQYQKQFKKPKEATSLKSKTNNKRKPSYKKGVQLLLAASPKPKDTGLRIEPLR